MNEPYIEVKMIMRLPSRLVMEDGHTLEELQKLYEALGEELRHGLEGCEVEVKVETRPCPTDSRLIQRGDGVCELCKPHGGCLAYHSKKRA